MSAPAPEALVLDAGQGCVLHGLRLPGAARMRLLFLHRRGSDLDAVLPLMHLVGLPEADKIAVDLPGHGLSPDAGDPQAALSRACDGLGREVALLVVACGDAAALGWTLAARPDVAGLCLLAPSGRPPADDAFLRRPVLVFLPSGADAAAQWQRFKARLRARWLEISLSATLDGMLRPEEPDCRQVATHLQGFARELLMQSAAGAAARPPSAQASERR